MALVCASAFAVLNREVSTTAVQSGGTFTVKYISSGVNPPFFYSIKDTLTGGCTLLDGKNVIATVLTSPQTETGAITVNAPSSDTICYLNGDSQFAGSALVNFAQASVKVGQGSGTSGSGGSSSSFGSIGLIVVLAIGGFILYKFFNPK